MSLVLRNVQILFKPVRAMALAAWFLVIVGVNSATLAVEPPSATAQSNAVVTAAGSKLASNALPRASQPDTNGLAATSSTNTVATATQLSQSPATNSTVFLDDKYKLAIGDRLSFRIVEDEEDPKALFVTDSADVEVPYIGRVRAENKTCKQLAAEIKTALEKKYYYQATVVIAVDLVNKSHGRVYLVGAVRVPGPVEIPGDEALSLSKAILRAGGFTDYADRRHVKVTRKDTGGKADKESFVVDVGEIFDRGKIEKDINVIPGDLIFVPDRLLRF